MNDKLMYIKETNGQEINMKQIRDREIQTEGQATTHLMNTEL